MSLPASNRKAPSRAVIAAAITAIAALGASAAVAQGQFQPQAQAAYGFQGQLPAGYGYAPQNPFAGYAVQPASTFGTVPGYGQAVPAQAAPQQLPVQQALPQPLPVPQPFPGYGVPGGFPAPTAAFDPYGAFGVPAQPAAFAPHEPNFAPHEPRRGTAAAPAPAQPATEAASSTVVAPDYTYESVPANPTGATYVGTSENVSTGTDPYQAVTPSYTQEYDAAAPAPVQTGGAYAVAVPAPAPAAQEPVTIGGYEFQSVPAAEYYDLGQPSAPAAVAVPVAPVIAAPAAVPAGTHFVQVAAFLDPNRANKLIAELGSSGVQAFAVPAQVRGKLYHRVRIGAASRQDAELVLNQVRGLNFYEARIVRG